MNCNQAKPLIDERVEAHRAGDARSKNTPDPRFKKLDAHLIACATCAAEYHALLQTRKLPRTVATDIPTEEEIKSMWTAIASAATLPVGSAVPVDDTTPTWWKTNQGWLLRFQAASTAAAAVLFLAAFIGKNALGPRGNYGIDLVGGTQLAAADAVAPPVPQDGGLTEFYDFKNLSRDTANMSYGYQVPFGPGDSRAEGATKEGQLVSAGWLKYAWKEGGEWNTTVVDDGRPELLLGLPLVAGAVGSEDGVDRIPGARFVAGPYDHDVNGSGQYEYGSAEPFSTATAQLILDFDGGRDDGPTVLEHAVGARSEDVRMDIEASKIPWWETLRYPDDLLASTPSSKAPGVLEEGLRDRWKTPVDLTPPPAPDGFSGRAVSPPDFAGLARIAPADVEQAEVQVPAEAESVGDQPQATSDQKTSIQSEPNEAKSPPSEQPQTQEPSAQQPVEQQQAPPQTQRLRRVPPASRPKIIKTGELSVEVESYEAAVERVMEIVRRADAFLADGSTTEQAGGALVGVMVIRVVPEQFEALFQLLKKHIGRVESENVKAADVTAKFVDLQARIRGLEMTEVRLQQLIQDKSFLDNVQALLEVEREVTRVRVQIEQMQGQLRVMADRIGMSTIRITIREPARTVPSASMSVEIPVLDFAARTLGDALRKSDGRLVSAKTAKRNDGTLKGDYVLEVSLAKFGDMLTAIESLGRVAQREVKDRQFGDADAPWADEVKCRIGLLLYERSRQLPSGEISMEIEDLDAAIAAMNPALGKANATVVSNDTTQRSDGSSRAELRLRIPAGAYAEFVAALAPLGRTTAKKISGEAGSIVGGAADVLCNLTLTLSEPILQVPSGRILIEVDAFPDARKRLSVIVAGKDVQVLASDSEQRSDGTWVGGFRLGIAASEMEQIVSQLESLGRVESRQIRGIGLGDLARVDPKSIGVVTLTLAEKAAIRPPVNRAGGAIRTQLRGALEGLYKSLGYILYGLIVLAPWIVIVTAIGWLTARAWRRRKQKAEPAT